LTVSCSIGLAVRSADMTAEKLYHEADSALYRAKEGGRNRIVLAGALSKDEAALEPAVSGVALSG
jgi:PleD family two-component response regulator